MGTDDCTSLTDFFFDGYMEQLADPNFIPVSSNDIFSELEGVSSEFTSMKSRFHEHSQVSQKKSDSDSTRRGDLNLKEADDREINSPKRKRQKLISSNGEQKVAHITVERNRRKQMNQHLNVLRSLLPSFYVKRSDQASIIGVVVDYITELQQVLQSLEAKKQRKVYTSDVLSPRPSLSPLSPQKPPFLPISPRTPLPVSPVYRPRLQQPVLYSYSNYLQLPSSAMAPPSPSSSSSINSSTDIVNELVANSKSAIADVEVKFSGSNLVLKTISRRFPGQATKIVSALEDLSLEILEAGVNTVDETMVNSFTIKIGIECQLSAEDLVQHIQQTFC